MCHGCCALQVQAMVLEMTAMVVTMMMTVARRAGSIVELDGEGEGG